MYYCIQNFSVSYFNDNLMCVLLNIILFLSLFSDLAVSRLNRMVVRVRCLWEQSRCVVVKVVVGAVI